MAVDESRFRAVNTRDHNYMPGAVRHRIEQLEASIERCRTMLDTTHRQEDELGDVRTM